MWPNQKVTLSGGSGIYVVAVSGGWRTVSQSEAVSLKHCNGKVTECESSECVDSANA